MEILFISQPISQIRATPGFPSYGFDEFDVLDSLVRQVKSYADGHRVCIRMHPKENRDKYDRYLGDIVAISQESLLEEDISRAGLIVGMCSPVLMQAAAAGKQVLSYEPNLIGPDPMPMNRLGITRRIGTEEELKMFLDQYIAGKAPGLASGARSFATPQATKNILAIIDELLL